MGHLGLGGWGDRDGGGYGGTLSWVENEEVGHEIVN